VQQPRSFGHVLGDVLTQRVLLSAAAREAEPTRLPASDRVGLYLERRVPRVEQDSLGRRWLVIEYQVINAPRALTALTLPALTIATDAGPLNVGAFPISVGPLTPPATFNQGDLQPLRPDRPVEPLPTAGIERQLKMALAALAAVLALWTGWWAWRNAREAQRMPFARAWRQLRRLDPTSAEAWLALHHALNATAGRAVHGRTLPRLLADAPHLQPLGPRLEAFFRHSEQRFFATTVGATPAGFALRELGLALRDAERRHHA
jgi:mxaA protein